MEKEPIVRMRNPIRYKPKPKIVDKPIPAIRATLRAGPALRPMHRTTLRPRPNPTPKPIHRTGPTPRPTPRSRKTMKRIPSPNPWANLNMKSANLLYDPANMNMKSANLLYDPANPSPKVKVDSSKLFQKMTELQDMLKAMKQTRKRNVSMNASAKAYLNRASYEDPLLDDSLKLKGIKGPSLG